MQNMQPRYNNNNRGNTNQWPKRNPLNDQRPPTPLESANMVDEPIPFCRPCESFYEESACAFARNILGEGKNQQINNVNQDASQESRCADMISSSFAINNFSDEKDLVTQAYGEKPSQEQILEIAKSKGYTYQRKGKERSQNKRITSDKYKSSLKIDCATWINSIKVSVPVIKLLKFPSQKASFFKALGLAQHERIDTPSKDEEIKLKDLNLLND